MLYDFLEPTPDQSSGLFEYLALFDLNGFRKLFVDGFAGMLDGCVWKINIDDELYYLHTEDWLHDPEDAFRTIEEYAGAGAGSLVKLKASSQALGSSEYTGFLKNDRTSDPVYLYKVHGTEDSQL